MDEYNDEKTLTAAIAHDMGAQFRTVTQFSRLLLNRSGEKFDKKECQWLQLLEKAGMRGQAMIDALVVYSTLLTESEKHTRFALNKVLDDVLKSLSQKIDSVHATIQVEGSYPSIHASRTQWQIMLTQLIENSLLYATNGERTCNVVVTSRVNQNGTFMLTVEDDGPGVSELHWPNLGKPFRRFQIDVEATSLGMGLACCQRIAQLSGGELSFSRSVMGGLAVHYLGPAEMEVELRYLA